MYKKYVKRLIDVFISVVALAILWPVLIIVAVLIKIESPGPAIFKQERLGKGGKVFKIYKFRSMCLNAEKTGSGQYCYKGDPRVTKIGRIIRATSIDELPQFVNILKGEMSLIGFRPPLTYHPYPIEEYTEEQKKIFAVRPGVTGWAQVHGRKTVEWNKRFEYNVWYADNVSFMLDLKILFLTVKNVLMNEDNENVGETHKTEEKSSVK